jgi:archaeosine synthase beta-subunit
MNEENEIIIENIFGSVGDYKSEKQRIIKCVKKLRKIKQGKITDWENAAEWHLKYSNYNGESVLALTIILSPTGCEWARKGGCTMCGEFEGSFKRNEIVDNPQFHIAQFASAIGNPKIWDKAKEEKKPITWLRIYQEGNYTNPDEMNFKAQEAILRLAMHIDGIKRITIESRPQYLSLKTIKVLSSLFKSSDVELEIGMGLEAVNSVVRNVCINKQESKDQFIKTIKWLKEFNIRSLAYVLLKPPFLNEAEAIEEAVATAHFAERIGFNRISFEPMSIHTFTLVDVLRNTGDYKIPWLWSVVEVTKRCKDISNIFGIGGIGYFPIPKHYTQNHCYNNENDCSRNFSDAIIAYNRSRDTKVFDKLSCKCKNTWESECNIEVKPLKQRIQEQLTRAELLIPNYHVDECEGNMEIRNQRILASGSQ